MSGSFDSSFALFYIDLFKNKYTIYRMLVLI